jgi:hypothetical protein
LKLGNGLTLESYDDNNFGFLRLEVGKNQIVGTYFSDKYSAGNRPSAKAVDSWTFDLAKKKVK